jgi:hypothetical protein
VMPFLSCRSHSEQAKRTLASSSRIKQYPESESPAKGRFYTKDQLDMICKGCGTLTTMGQALAETYARVSVAVRN